MVGVSRDARFIDLYNLIHTLVEDHDPEIN